MYSSKSSSDKGTLKQLQHLIHRTNVSNAVKNDFPAVQRFLSVVLEAHLVTAAMEFFGMTSPNGLPSRNMFPPNYMELPVGDRRAYFDKVMQKFIDQFVLHYLDTIPYHT